MGSFLSNTFTEERKASLRMYISENRRAITIILGVCIFLVAASILLIWWESDDSGRTQRLGLDLPSPIIGNGPFGYGMYLPPVDKIMNQIQ